MINGIEQTTLPVAVAAQQEPPPQTRGQEDISADFAGAAHRVNENSVVQQSLDRYGDGIPFALELGDRNAPASGQTRNQTGDGAEYSRGNFVVGEDGGIIFIPIPDTGTGASGVWPDDRPWDSDFSGGGHAQWRSTGAQSPQVHATLDVSANVPVRVQLGTRESPLGSQGSNRPMPASYSQRVVTGTDQGRRLMVATRSGAFNVASAAPTQATPSSKDDIDEPTQKFLDEWSAAIGEGPDIGNQFLMGIIDNSVAAVKERIHAALERKLIAMLGQMAEHLRMPTLEKLLKQPTDNTMDLVEKHLPEIGKVIPEKEKKALTDLLDRVGIKWPKLFG